MKGRFENTSTGVKKIFVIEKKIKCKKKKIHNLYYKHPIKKYKEITIII